MSDPRLRVITRPNPFSPSTETIDHVPWRDGATLLDYWSGDPRWVCVYAGRVIPSEEWGEIRPEPGSEVRFVPSPGGIGLLVGSLVATGLQGWVGAAVFYGTAALVEFGIAAGVSYAANKLFGVEEIGDDLLPVADNTVHRFEGIRTTAQSGSPIQLVYGDHIVGGNIIANKLAGNLIPPLVGGTPLLQIRPSIYDIVVGLCHGPVAAIGDILVNGNDLTNYTSEDELFVTKALGTSDQAASFFFDSVGSADSVPVNLPLENETSTSGGIPADWVTSTMTRAAEQVRINLNFPNGLYFAVGPVAQGVQIGVRYKLEGEADTEYSAWQEFAFSALVGAEFQAFCEITFPTRDIYDLQVRKTSPIVEYQPENVVDDMEWDSFTQVSDGAFSYPFLANFAARIYTTSAILSGSNDFTAAVTGIKVESYDDVGEEWVDDPTVYNNPAWCAIDALTNARYGLGHWFSREDLDLPAWVEFAAYCDDLVDDGAGSTEKRYTFDGVFEGGENAWQAVRRILGVARAYVIRRGYKLGVQWHRPRPVSMIFNRKNIKGNSVEVKYLGPSDRITQYNIRYLNAARDYTPDSEPVQDFTAIAAAGTARSRDVDMFGITRKSHARRHGRFLLNLGQYGDRVISWEADIRAVFCEVGDVVEIADQKLKWGVASGAVQAGTSTTVTIDTDVELVDGVEYEIRVQHDADDSIETRTISSAAGQYLAGSALTVSEAFTTTPAADSPWVIGSVLGIPRQVLVTSIRQTDDFTVRLVGIRYDARIHDDTITPIGSVPVAELPSTATPACLASPPTLTEVFEGGEARVRVSWVYGSPPIGGARIYYRRTTGGISVTTWQLAGTVSYPESTFTISGLVAGETYAVTVIQSSTTGAHLQPGQCDSTSITLEGLGPVPPAVTGVAVSQAGPNLTITWDQVTPAPTFYEVRRGESWVLSTPVGTAPTNMLTTTAWVPPLTSEPQKDRFWVRAVSATGLYGGAGFVDASSLALWFGGSAVGTYDGFTDAWAAGTATNMSATGNSLELTSLASPGSYETGALAFGSTGNFRVGVVAWATNEEGPTLGSQSYTLGSTTGKRGSFEGPIDPATWPVALVIEIRTATSSGGLTSAPWTALTQGVVDVYGVSHFEFRVTLSTTTSDWSPTLNYLAVTAEALP